MHDIDRTLNEFGTGETGAGEMGLGEMGETGFELGNAEAAFSGELSSPFNEVQEMELANELLGINSEAGLNNFLGDLIGKAAGAARTFISSPTGQALGGVLKQAAKQALPVVGGAIGGYFGGSTGSSVGSRLGSAAGDLLGLEMGEMNQEEREYEMARRFVRFAGSTVRRSARFPAGMQPSQAARRAAAYAARLYLPFLLGDNPVEPVSAPCSCGSGRSGRWYRRGRKIILIGF